MVGSLVCSTHSLLFYGGAGFAVFYSNSFEGMSPMSHCEIDPRMCCGNVLIFFIEILWLVTNLTTSFVLITIPLLFLK